jgi:hypothetical protein
VALARDSRRSRNEPRPGVPARAALPRPPRTTTCSTPARGCST